MQYLNLPIIALCGQEIHMPALEKALSYDANNQRKVGTTNKKSPNKLIICVLKRNNSCLDSASSSKGCVSLMLTNVCPCSCSDVGSAV